MQEHTLQDQKVIICHCTCTSKQQIIELIHKGAHSVEALSRMTGATAGCGGCETWVTELLADTLQSHAAP